MSILRRSLISAVVMMTAVCVKDNTLNRHTAEKRIDAAYFEKLRQCDHQPYFLIFVPHDVQEPDVVRCEWDLLNMSCPAETIPGNCILLMLKKAPRRDLDGK